MPFSRAPESENAQRENGGKHDGHEKVDQEHARHREPPQLAEDQERADHVGRAIEAHDLVGGESQQPAPVKRPIRKHREPTDARLAAPLLLMTSAPWGRFRTSPAASRAKSRVGREEFMAGDPGGRYGRHFGGHVIDEETENAGLRGHIEKLRGHGHHEMRVGPDGVGERRGRHRRG